MRFVNLCNCQTFLFSAPDKVPSHDQGKFDINLHLMSINHISYDIEPSH